MRNNSSSPSIETLHLRLEALLLREFFLRSCMKKSVSKIFFFEMTSILEDILTELTDHYSKNIQVHQNLVYPFYVVDQEEKWHLLDEDCSTQIQNLWHGKYSSFTTSFKKMKCEVSLHSNLMRDGMPLVLMKVVDKYVAIVKRNVNTQHLLLFKFQPRVHGMKCNADVAKQWMNEITDTESVTVLNNKKLEKLSALWLGTKPRDPPQNVLHVHGQLLIDFLDLIQKNKNAQCFFLLCGQEDLFAYIQVNDAEHNILMVVPVGYVCMY